VGFQCGVGPDHEIREIDLPLHWPLGRQALADLSSSPIALPKALPLRTLGASDADDRIKAWRGPSLKEQGNQDRPAVATRGAPTFRLSLPSGADARMKDGFQIGARAGVGKNHPGQFSATQSAIRGQYPRAKSLHNFLQGGLARFGQLARYFVGVRHVHAALPE